MCVVSGINWNPWKLICESLHGLKPAWMELFGHAFVEAFVCPKVCRSRWLCADFVFVLLTCRWLKPCHGDSAVISQSEPLALPLCHPLLIGWPSPPPTPCSPFSLLFVFPLFSSLTLNCFSPPLLFLYLSPSFFFLFLYAVGFIFSPFSPSIPPSLRPGWHQYISLINLTLPHFHLQPWSNTSEMQSKQK